jgi:hypothetical protein
MRIFLFWAFVLLIVLFYNEMRKQANAAEESLSELRDISKSISGIADSLSEIESTLSQISENTSAPDDSDVIL